MSTQFRPIEIPPGVVSMSTKQQRSSNWVEVNLMRWVEGNLEPVGGQSQYSYAMPFASRCRAVHSWYDLSGIHYIAYLCEQHLYVDTGGSLTDITPTGGMTPPPDPTVGGYGDGLYSDGTYGTPRDHPSIVPIDSLPRAWSIDNFGAVLLAMTSPDGRLLAWNPIVGGPAAVIGTAPLGRLFVVTPERFVMIFATADDGTVDGGSFRRFAWCDQEDVTNWDFTDVASQAGFLDIEPASPIITAISTQQGILIWTGTTVYVSRFLGIPYVYDYVPIGENCTPWSPLSFANTPLMPVWFSQQGLFSFNGTAIAPVACNIRSWIDDDIDIVNVREQACMVHVATFNEIWWFFPQKGQPYNTRVAIYNYKEGWWSQGNMSRSAGVSSAYTVQTIMADGFTAYQHELGNTYPAGVGLPWAETFDLNLVSGAALITIKQMQPDITGDVNNIRYSLFYRNSRSVMPDPVTGAPVLVVEKQTPLKQVRPNGYVDFRTTGRDIRLRIELAGPQVNSVSVGQHLIDGVARGDR